MESKVELVKDEINPYLEAAKRRLETQIEEVFNRFGDMIIESAKRLARERLKKPGTYLQKFAKKVTPDSLTVENTHHAARILEYGSKAHEITGPLWFFKEGEWKWRRRVMHPGTKAKMILTDAFKEHVEALGEAIRELVGG